MDLLGQIPGLRPVRFHRNDYMQIWHYSINHWQITVAKGTDKTSIPHFKHQTTLLSWITRPRLSFGCICINASTCTSYKATSEGVSRAKFLAKFKNLKFWQFFKICNFDFVLFWLGIWCESLVWVIMGRRGVSQNAGVLVVLVAINILSLFAGVETS